MTQVYNMFNFIFRIGKKGVTWPEKHQIWVSERVVRRVVLRWHTIQNGTFSEWRRVLRPRPKVPLGDAPRATRPTWAKDTPAQMPLFFRFGSKLPTMKNRPVCTGRASEKRPNALFKRADWALFRDQTTTGQKSGVQGAIPWQPGRRWPLGTK